MGLLLRGWATATAWLAAGWALVFAGWHVAWAAGSTVGLGPSGTDGLRAWLPGHDLVVAGLCLLGAGVATLVAVPPRDRAWAHRLRVVAAAVGLVLLVRGAVGVAQLVWWLAVDPGRVGVGAVWELYLLEGALLYLAAAGIGLGGRPRGRSRTPAEPPRVASSRR